VLIEAERVLLQEHQRIFTGHQRLSETNRPHAGLAAGCEVYVELVTDPEEIKRQSNSLMTIAQRNWMTLENLLQKVPMDEASCAPPLPAFEGRVRCRSIYEARFLEIPVARRNIEAAVAAGEEARLLPHIGMKMKMADEATAFLPLTPTGMDGALIIRSPTVLGALREYFELLWEKATPFGATGPDELTRRQKQVLKLLAGGLLDEAIAHQLNVSVQTVRRHITIMRELLDVGQSRFAMGAAANRRGWLD
jgi:DNA-binding CsgD family transcriptional regulator